MPCTATLRWDDKRFQKLDEKYDFGCEYHPDSNYVDGFGQGGGLTAEMMFRMNLRKEMGKGAGEEGEAYDPKRERDPRLQVLEERDANGHPFLRADVYVSDATGSFEYLTKGRNRVQVLFKRVHEGAEGVLGLTEGEKARLREEREKFWLWHWY